MQFARQLRPGIRRGDITCSIRIWQRPQVKVGGRYRMEEGEIEVDSMRRIEIDDITPELARRSGFAGVEELLEVAQHGPGHDVYLITFHYVPPGAGAKRGAPARSPRRRR